MGAFIITFLIILLIVIFFGVFIYIVFIDRFLTRKKERNKRIAKLNLEEDFIKKHMTNNTKIINAKINKVDEYFSGQEFLLWVRYVYNKIQEAYNQRDISVLKNLEGNVLLEEHSKDIQEYINKKIINVRKEININYTELYKYSLEEDIESVTVAIRSIMINYDITDETGEIVKGNVNEYKKYRYYMTFSRKLGNKTSNSFNMIKNDSCLNCGAKVKSTSISKCEYCGSTLINNKYDKWILTNMQRIDLK